MKFANVAPTNENQQTSNEYLAQCALGAGGIVFEPRLSFPLVERVVGIFKSHRVSGAEVDASDVEVPRPRQADQVEQSAEL